MEWTVTHHRAVRRLLALLGASVLALGITACGEDEADAPAADAGAESATPVPAETEDDGAEPAEITLGRLLARPESYVGQRVTISGAVHEPDLDEDPSVPAIFTLGPGPDEDLLVLPTTQADIPSAELSADEVVEVQGRVVEFNENLGETNDLLYETVEGGLLPNAEDPVALVANYAELQAGSP